jgi:hypothetical protein
MPLDQQITVATAVTDVLERSGFAGQGTSALTAQPRVRAFLRQAAKELVNDAAWTELVGQLRIPLVEGQDRYEFPEESYLGGIIALTCELENGVQYPLTGGIRQQDWMPTPDPETTYRVAVGQPDRWRIVDKEIEILPAPTATYINLVCYYRRALGPLTDPDELLPFEAELLIQRATILTMRFYQKPGSSDLERDFTKYKARRIAAQSVGRVFNVGGRKSHYVTRDKRVPRGGAYGVTGRNASYGPTWNPWG